MDPKGFEKKPWFPYFKNMYDEIEEDIMSVDAKGYEEKPWWPYVLDLQEGGGGGSSDFSTAEVTLVLTMPEGVTATSEYLNECIIPYPSISTGSIFQSEYINASEHKVILPLYNGQAYFRKPCANDDYGSYSTSDVATVSLSGNVQFDSQLGLFSVTGDCTVTATLDQDGGPK